MFLSYMLRESGQPKIESPVYISRSRDETYEFLEGSSIAKATAVTIASVINAYAQETDRLQKKISLKRGSCHL
jgi:hypothetical protein